MEISFVGKTKTLRQYISDKIITESDILFIKDIHTESDANFFGELLDVYITELPQMIRHITSANENGDHKNLYFYAHKLKGSSITLGINPITEVCAEIESFAREKKLNERITELTVQLVKKFDQVVNELEVIKEKYTKFPP
jgi:HPt (histidine-containing phosphotransfer) domain-containing protein